MNLHDLIIFARKEGMEKFSDYVKRNYVEEEVDLIISAVEKVLRKESAFLKIDIDSGDHKKPMVKCPLFGKNVHIEETCYGCRYNPATGRWEGRDGEYFQCNYIPGHNVEVWPATRTIQSSAKSSAKRTRKEFQEGPGNRIQPRPPRAEKAKSSKKTAEDIPNEVERKIIEDKVTLPDAEELSRFNDMSREELKNQLKMYTELQGVLASSPPGENITLQDCIAIVEHIRGLLGNTPEDLQASETSIEEVPPEEVDAARGMMRPDFDDEEIIQVAASLWRKFIPPSVLTREELEKEANRLGFVSLSKIASSAPPVLERCVKKVMEENRGKEGFTKSDAFAICISSLQDKHPEVKEWARRKKKVFSIDSVPMHELSRENLEKRLSALREAEFVVRSNMNIHDEKTIAEGSNILNKIAEERKRINEALSTMLDVEAMDSKPLVEEFEFDRSVVEKIDHPLAEEFRKASAEQENFNWEEYLSIMPQVLVEKYKGASEKFIKEAAKQEITPKISLLPENKKREIYSEFMRRVEGELEKNSKKKKCRHMNEDNTFKGGFDGCVAHFMECEGLKKENAEKLCAYIARRKKGK